MNRSATAPLLPAHQEEYDWLGQGYFDTSPNLCESQTAESFFAPTNYKENYPYPLIVWLHGPRSCELELNQVMPLISCQNYVAAAPRGTKRHSGKQFRFGWCESPEAIADACHRVVGCIESAQNRYHIHRERIFLAGVAEGGTMAYRVGLEMPELFAAAISLAGPVPRGGRPFKNINRSRKLQLMLSVSPNQDYSLQAVMDDVKHLHAAGCRLDLRLHPDGDQLTTEMLKDMNQWVLEHACPKSIIV